MGEKNIQNIIYYTQKGNKYPLEVIYKKISSDMVCYEPERVRNWCKLCSNFNRTGGCPPRAPLYDVILTKEAPTWLIAIKFYSEHKPETIKNLTNIAMHWKFQDAILARLLNKLGHQLVNIYGGIFLASGYCMGCPGKKCSFKLGEDKCRNPKKRTYSMEATGINVVETILSQLSEKLYWYQKGKADIPYMMKCMLYIQTSNQENIPIYSLIEKIQRKRDDNVRINRSETNNESN